MRGHDINMTHVIIPCCWTNFWQASVQKQLVLRQVLLHLLPFGLLSFHFDFIKKNKTFDSRFTKVTDAHWYAPLRHDNGQLNSLFPLLIPHVKWRDAMHLLKIVPLWNRFTDDDGGSLLQMGLLYGHFLLTHHQTQMLRYLRTSKTTFKTLLSYLEQKRQAKWAMVLYGGNRVQGGGKFGQFCRVLQSENQSIKT